MPRVGKLGASMLRGNTENFYIRCDDDLDDLDCDTNRGNQEYPHIHVTTDGPGAGDNIIYIGITFGEGGRNINIFKNDQHLLNFSETRNAIETHCPGISPDRIRPLTCYLHGIPIQVLHQ